MNQPPNILLLVAEDTGRHHGCYGDASANTPNIDRLAAEGIRYQNAHSTAPVCAPSRGALMCGRIAYSVGNHHMRSRLIEPPKLFTESLREAGYYVNWSNKTDFNFEPPASFADDHSEWFDALAEGRIPHQPWLLYHNFGVTHESGMWPENWEKAIAGNLSPDELCDPKQVSVPPYLPDTPEVRGDIARYYDTLAIQDKQVGRALDALDRSGQRDNTIVIYLSDHGRGLIREKRFTYEAGIHLPLIIRAPKIIQPGTVSNELISWLDIAPTILSLCNAEQMPARQGRIFLGSETEPEPSFIYAGRDRMGPVFDRVRCARSRKYLYVRNDFPELPYASHSAYMEKQLTTQSARREFAAGRLDKAQSLWFLETKPKEELYDCDADPDNLRNLADEPALSNTLKAHREALSEFINQVGDYGERAESDLIADGLVADVLCDYQAAVEALPESYRIGQWIDAPVDMPQ